MDKHTRTWTILGLGFWFAINLIQASFTLLSHDEAYYWMYSRFLDWGYFDHPPAIAVSIKAGYLFFKWELGVRIISIILSTLTILLLLKICGPQKSNIKLFLLIVFSIPLVHAGGFLATPDVPFIFFTTCFFFVYKNYLEQDDWKNTFILSLIMALLLYSKYHSVLVIFFTILSNLRILSRKTFWIAGIVAFALFLLHLYWQYTYEYPSFKYHLFERSSIAYKIDFTLEYLGGQLLVLGPLLGILLFFSALKNNSKSLFNNALKFNLIGIFVFFLLSSFKSRVEANWTSAAFIPLIILSFGYIKDKENLKKWTFILGTPTIILLLIVRILLMMEQLPFNLKSEFHQWDIWAEQIKARAQKNSVVFMNSYQKASKYTFYTGEPSHTLNNFMYRKNQYDLWPFEDSLQGKNVFVILNYEGSQDTLPTVIGEKYYYKVVEDFHSYNKVKITALNEAKLKVLPGDSIRIKIELKNQGSYDANFLANPDLPSNLTVNFYLKGQYYTTQWYPLEINEIKQDQSVIKELQFAAPENPGDYTFRIAIATGWLPMGLNSDLNKLEVIEK